MEFYKIQSCGNHYIVLDECQTKSISHLAKRLCKKETGIGAIACIFVKENPLGMAIYDENGEEKEIEGSDLFCFSRYVLEKGYAYKKDFELKMGLKKYPIDLLSSKPFSCKIDIGIPSFSNGKLRVNDKVDCFGRIINIDNYRITIYSLFLGDIETILFVDKIKTNLLSLAEEIANYKVFSAGTNVNFVEISDENNIEIRCYNKEKGWVCANGLGVGAAVVAAKRLGLVGKKVIAHLEMGKIIVEIGRKENVSLEGGAYISFVGQIKEMELC